MKFRGGEFSTGTTGNFQSELTAVGKGHDQLASLRPIQSNSSRTVPWFDSRDPSPFSPQKSHFDPYFLPFAA